MPTTAAQLLHGELDAVPARVVGAVEELAGAPTALYVLDLEGRVLVRVAGDAGLPFELELPHRIGPVLFEGCTHEVERRIAEASPEARAFPLWLRGQAACTAVTAAPPAADLAEVLEICALALEIARGHSDVIDVVRRRRRTTTAAELQQDMLPPPIARAGDTDLAGVILPAYAVGGDWFDWTYNPDGLRFSVGDAVGRGERAMALGAVALSANRAARRRVESLEQAACLVNETVAALGGDVFVTCVLASYDALTATVRWVRCGHPSPLLMRADGTLADLPTAGHLPLGTYDEPPDFIVHEARLRPGDRFVLYSDGITEARRHDGSFFGLDGLVGAIDPGDRAPGTVRSILNRLEAEADDIEDDATLMVLRRDPVGG